MLELHKTRNFTRKNLAKPQNPSRLCEKLHKERELLLLLSYSINTFIVIVIVTVTVTERKDTEQ